MLTLTSVGVSLGAVAILQPVGPRAFIPCVRCRGLPHAVTTLEALRPLTPIQPPAARLDAQSMALAILPLALECAPAATKHGRFTYLAVALTSVVDCC